jgi:hypothetical protein
MRGASKPGFQLIALRTIPTVVLTVPRQMARTGV